MSILDDLVEQYKDDVYAAYYEALLWSSTDDEGEPLDRNYDDDDINEQSKVEIEVTIDDFLLASMPLLIKAENDELFDNFWKQVGHDLVLTQNETGVGFWESEWSDYGDTLTKFARKSPPCNIYVGDDEKLHAAIM